MDIIDLVTKIHATPTKAVLYITGGGTEVLPLLLKRGGGSATLLSARVPYENAETVELLGGTPEKFVSEETTCKLAMAAYQRALILQPKDVVTADKYRAGDTEDYPVIGVACSSGLQKTPTERFGRVHHVYAALQTGSKTVSYVITLNTLPNYINPENGDMYERDAYEIREMEENLNALVLLNLIAEGCGVIDRLSIFPLTVDPVRDGIQVERHDSLIHSEYFPNLLDGSTPALLFDPAIHKKNLTAFYDAEFIPLMPIDTPSFLLPGSFNPMHAGHVEMQEYVEKVIGQRCDFELSVRNADKPSLDFLSIQNRLKTMPGRRVWLTNAATFLEKSKIFPGCIFLVGHDIAARICDPKYGDLNTVFDTFEANKTRFIVFGREYNGSFQTSLESFPERFRKMVVVVVTDNKYPSLSSSDIRREISC